VAVLTKKPEAQMPVTTRFEFEKLLGTGGMGSVYRALDRRTGETVAVKVLKYKLSDNPTLHHRFAREFKAARGLEHPNIVRAILFENDGETSYCVFEYVEGCSLADRLESHGRIPEGEALRIVTQIAQALHYAHQRQVVHRDVKPDNIMLLPDGRAKLTDFGLAKDYSDAGDQDLTRAASGLGTPFFMAPEQFVNAKNAGALCDVYSLGATLYNLVTGELPYYAKFPLAILSQKEKGGLSNARKIVPGLSERIDIAIRTATEPLPERRPQSCLEFFKLLTARKRSAIGTARMPPTTSPVDGQSNRRAFVRVPMKVGACAAVNIDVHSNDGAEELWPLVVHDLSAGGMGILLARRFEPGTVLNVELVEQLNEKPTRFPVKVVRLQRDKAGYWLHGCAFEVPLPVASLNNLLKYS
jgi:serine/threonine protein kinase